MTDRNKADDKDQSAVGDPSQGGELSKKKREENNEWLRDQVGEDSNLSGSTTFRTLPDQPLEDETPEDLDGGTQDTKDRQSNR